MRVFFTVFLLCAAFFSGNLFANAPGYLSTTAGTGDGIYSILERYRAKTPCNIEQFRKINGLKKNQGLQNGREYKLPIFLYSYNGKSIRSTTGVNDLPWAEQVQKYNEFMLKAGVKQGDYRDNRELWVPYHMMYCKEESVPLDEVVPATASATPVSETKPAKNIPLRGTYDIFGEKYAKVPLESTRLSGKVFYIVSGHGGPDPGAIGTLNSSTLCEDEYAYDVGLRLSRNLLAHGATVYIITRDENDGIRDGEILPCDKDETLWVDQKIPAGQSERLFQRSDQVNMLFEKNQNQGVRYQRLVVIHVDSDDRTEQIDMYFYHRMDDPDSRIFATRLYDMIKAKYDEFRKGRGYEGKVTPRDLHMLRETLPVAVYIELGNIRNRTDQSRLIVEENRQLMANWLYDGLLQDAEGK
ncbi:MAG: N-acetylmuramoyl-L-alanine amidase [Bacteroidia bacterium]